MNDRASLAVAVDRYLDSVQTATTRASYAETLARPADVAGPVDGLTPKAFAAVMARWDDAAPATWNRHLSALTSFTAWAQRQELLATNPARRLERRRPTRRGDRAVPRARLEKLFSDDRNGLRERILWRMLYETAARAEEILSLNVEDHDTEFRRTRVVSKGGAIEHLTSLGRYVRLGEETSARITRSRPVALPGVLTSRGLSVASRPYGAPGWPVRRGCRRIGMVVISRH
jgi:integrase